MPQRPQLELDHRRRDDSNFRFASTVADRYYVMEHGRIIDQFANAELEANLGKLHDYLGV